MTATNSPTSPTELSAEQKAHEPSMDDILASIRRLISDDDALPLSRRARAVARSRVATPSGDAAEVQPGAQGTEPVAPPRDAFFGLVHRLGRHSSATAPERPSQPEPRHEPIVSPPPASVIAKTPALKLRDFALKNFVTRPDPDAWGEPERAPTVEALAASAETTAFDVSSAPLVAEGLRPSLPTTEALAVASAATQAARPISSVVSLPMRPAHASEGRSKVPPLPLRAPIFAPPAAGSAAEQSAETLRQTPEEPALLSSASDAKVGASFEALAGSLLARDKDLLDRAARELLRPMLKDWLDDNLPDLVERLVRAEIERIARGRG